MIIQSHPNYKTTSVHTKKVLGNEKVILHCNFGMVMSVVYTCDCTVGDYMYTLKLNHETCFNHEEVSRVHNNESRVTKNMSINTKVIFVTRVGSCNPGCTIYRRIGSLGRSSM